MAATLLSEQGWSSDAIERQLAHQDPRPLRSTYNFAEYLPERRRMMQAWADYLDQLAGRSIASKITLKRKRVKRRLIAAPRMSSSKRLLSNALHH
jgi:hypothetical protein